MSKKLSRNKKKPGRPKKDSIGAEEVRGAKYLGNILGLLKPLHSHCDCENRDLHYDEFVSYLLLYFFTPVLTSMRGIQQVSTLKKIQEKLKLPRFSLGSFSEAGRLFNPELLKPIIEQLGSKVAAASGKLAPKDKALIAVDGSLLRAIPKMVWALWLDDEHRAAKLHLQYDIPKGIPTIADVTDANTDEKAMLRKNLTANNLYVLDRGYACYQLLAEILDTGSSFVARILNNASYKVIEKRPVSAAAQEAGVQEDVIVTLGSTGYDALKNRKLRLVRIHVPDKPPLPGERRTNRTSSKTKQFRTTSREQTILLATDLLDEDVEVICQIYKSRWQIEIFFRWFKKVLEADRLLSQSKNGMTIVVYCALIASLLVALWTGRKPTKRTFELICLYFSGWVEDDELVAHLEKLKKAD